MALITPPAFLGLASNQYPASRLRRVLQTVIGDMEGVTGPGDMLVTQTSTPSMSVQVAAGRAWVTGDTVARQGSYLVENDATTTVGPFAAAHASLARIDLVVARVYDASPDGGSAALDTARFEIIPGTPASVPTPPSVPAGALELARVSIPAAAPSVATAQITDRRARVHGPLGVQPSCLLYRVAGGTTASGWSACTWDGEKHDTDKMHSTETNPSRITVPVAGLYQVFANWGLQETGAPTGERLLGISVNGQATPGLAVSSHPAVVASSLTRMNVACFANLAAGDSLEALVFNGQGAALTFYADAAGFPARFGATYVGRAA